MARSNYADQPTVSEFTGGLPEHRDRLSSNPRAYSPADGENDEGGYSTLAVGSGGDWSWKPYGHPGARTNHLKQAPMQTFRGVPPSAAELYRSTMHQPG